MDKKINKKIWGVFLSAGNNGTMPMLEASAMLHSCNTRRRCSDKYVHSRSKEPCPDSQATSIGLRRGISKIQLPGCCEWSDADDHQHMLQ
jgi:hypothetical protein